MQGRLKRILRLLGRGRPLFILLGWGVMMAGSVLSAIFQGYLLPSTYYGGAGNSLPIGVWLPYLEVFGASVLAGIVMKDAARTIVSFFGSYGLAAFLTYIVLALPGMVGTFPFADLLSRDAAVISFTALFPIPLLAGILGSVVGSGLSEKLL